jgi:hypothetical protein
MNQKTLVALSAMVVIAILAFVSMRRPPKGEHVGPRERPIAALKAADVKVLEIAANGGKDKTTLTRDGDAWKMTAPAAHPADANAVKAALDQLEKAAFGDLVTVKKVMFADLEVRDEKGVHVVARGDGGKGLFDGWVGKAVSGFTMVRPGGKDQVWQATGLFKYTFAKESKVWRDHVILSFARDDTSRLAVEQAGQRLILEKLPPPAADKDGEPAKPAPEARWKVVESTAKVDPLDDGVANGVVQALSALNAADFEDSGDPGAAGLAPPRLRITVTNKGTPATLLIGGRKGDDVYAQLEGNSQIYLLHKYSLDRAAVKPADFRDKTLIKAKDSVTALEVQTGGSLLALESSDGGWKFGKASKGEKGEIDDSKAKLVASSFDDLKGSSFAEAADLPVAGLAKPSATATVHLRDRSTVVLKVGAATREGSDYYVQRAGTPDVLLVKKFQVDRFLKKASDLVKTPTPAKS